MELVPVADWHLIAKEGNKAMQQHRTLRWLLILLIITTALFLYQVAAGAVAKSLTLLADSGHAAADVIGYAVNYGVERYKMGVMQGGGDSASSASLVARADTWGGGASVVVLIVATCFAILEALDRLNDKESPEDFAAMGFTLLLFSVISTAANVATLLLYRYWHPPCQEAPGEALEGGIMLEQAGGRGSPPALRHRPEEARPTPPDSEASPPGPPPPRRLFAARADVPAPAYRRKLNLTGGFSANRRCAGDCSDDACNLAGVAPSPVLLNTPAGSASSSRTGSPTSTKPLALSRGGSSATGSNWATAVHMLAHPGCAGQHGSGSSSSGGASFQAAEEVNLNVSTAMLHLVADVLRGISILAAALVMQSGCVARQLGKVDAVCALLVAGLVLLGAASMVSRFWASAKGGDVFCMRKQQQAAARGGAAATEEADDEDRGRSEGRPAVEGRSRREHLLAVEGRGSLLL